MRSTGWRCLSPIPPGPFLAAAASGSACPIGCPLSSMRGARSSRSAPSSSSGSSPHGRTAPLAITFAAIGVILLAPRADQAYAAAMGFMVGTVLAAVLRGDHCICGAAEVGDLCRLQPRDRPCPDPGRAPLMAQPWQTAMFTAMAANFVPLLAPANQMSYDTAAILQRRVWRSSRASAPRRFRFA